MLLYFALQSAADLWQFGSVMAFGCRAQIRVMMGSLLRANFAVLRALSLGTLKVILIRTGSFKCFFLCKKVDHCKGKLPFYGIKLIIFSHERFG